MNEFQFQTTPSIILRNGAARELGVVLQERGKFTHILIVTDANLLATGILEPALQSLRATGHAFSIYDSVVADPPDHIVLEAVSRAKEAGADCVIGIGGGSPMDVAKVVALMMTATESLEDIYGVGMATSPRTTPLILVPTTSGTGSEVTPISILTTGETTKKGIVAPQLYADLALLEPELTLGLPQHVTAATGIDAMVHAFEAYTSRHKKNPISDMLAKAALEKLHHNILKVCENGDDLEARGEMLLGAMMAGQAFANAPVAAVHALAYPIGGIFHVPHGLSNSLVMPHVLRFNLESAASSYAELARVIFPEISGTTAQRAEKFIEAMEVLAEDTGIPKTLREVGIAEHDLDRLAEDAMLQTRLLINNPREVTREDAREIYGRAL